ncbi:HEAT repeat domain-containing protein [Planococcus maritimus]|uniref:HEAT repeat domain-containing protein n=1 Tax=Planococcus maritimus TaxID=192421 RepID=UPI00232E956B|nr:HEAT repeat domain-containing protein [Planococcus maritimus]
MNLFFFWMLSLSLFIGQLVLLGILAWRKQRTNRKESSVDRQYDDLTDAFSSYMIDQGDRRFLQQLDASPDKQTVLERLLNHYVAVTKTGPTSDEITALAEQYLAQRYAKLLKQRNWAMRMNTLYFIEDFRMASLIPQLKEKLQKHSKLDQETQQLIRTLASLNEPVAIAALAEFPEAPARLYIDVFKRLDELTKLDELDAALDASASPALKHAAISYIGMAGIMLFLPRVEKELENENPEMRIQALKALLHLQYMNDPGSLTPFFSSDSWQERMFASQIAGALQLSRYKERLSELLGDSVWWVRYSAAEALTQFSDGDILLSHLSTNHPDRYARDMANQWKTSLSGSEQ